MTTRATKTKCYRCNKAFSMTNLRLLGTKSDRTPVYTCQKCEPRPQEWAFYWDDKSKPETN